MRLEAKVRLFTNFVLDLKREMAKERAKAANLNKHLTVLSNRRMILLTKKWSESALVAILLRATGHESFSRSCAEESLTN